MKKEILIFDLIKVLLDKWWCVVLSAFLFGGLVLAYSVYLVTPTYVSHGMIYVDSEYFSDLASLNDKDDFRDLNLNNIMTSQRLATTYIELLKSDYFLNTVCEYANIGIKADRLKGLVSIKTKNNTEILDVSVSNSNPQTAAILVDAILIKSKDEITRVVKGGSVEIIDRAKLPVNPSAPNKFKNTLFGMFFGAVVSSILIIIIHILDNRVRDQSDLLRRYDYAILGLIPSIRSSTRNYYYAGQYRQGYEELNIGNSE